MPGKPKFQYVFLTVHQKSKLSKEALLFSIVFEFSRHKNAVKVEQVLKFLTETMLLDGRTEKFSLLLSPFPLFFSPFLPTAFP